MADQVRLTAYTTEPVQLVASDLQFIWHHRCHEVWANETLYFWRLSFSPTYDGREILSRIKGVMFDHRVLSYAIYELTGEHDLMLRLWLPPSVTHDAFDQALNRALQNLHAQRIDSFAVHQIVSHWVWDNHGTEPMRFPHEQLLAERLADSDIQKINEGQITLDEFRWYAEKGLVASCNPGEGIKFALVIPRAATMSIFARDRMRRTLKDILVRARNVTEISLYSGAGFGEFLLMGKVDPNHFEDLNHDFIQEINEQGLREIFGIRTYTHIVVSSPVSSQTLQDRIPLRNEVLLDEDILTAEEYLERDEEERLEFKGSAFVNVNRWLLGDGKKIEDETVTNEGVLRAIVGLLNGGGGRVVLGVLEAKRFDQQEAKDRLGNMPRHGRYIVCGVNVDYGKRSGWDEFLLRITDVIESRITPSPRLWVKLDHEDVEGRDVCVICVRPPRTDWFYLKDDPNFYARIGNSTRQLAGPEADGHKRSHPR